MALRELFAAFGIDVDTKQLEKADKGVDALWGKLKQLAPALAGGAIGGAMLSFAHTVSEMGDQIAKDAIRVGITGERLQELGFAAGQSGASVEGMKVALLSLSDRMADAAKGSKETGAAFTRLGIKVKDSSGNLRGSDEVMLDAAEAISKIKSPAQQAATAMDLFGRQGRELLPFLKEGREGINKLTDEAKALGGGFSGKALKASENYNDALGRLTLVSTSAKGAIAVVLLPVLQRLVDFVTKAGAAFLTWVKNSYAIETALAALGVIMTVLAVKTALVAAPVLAAAAAFAILFLLVEDIVTLFQGGESVVGEFIDKLFGVGTAAEGVKQLKATWAEFSAGLAASLPTIREVFDKIKWLAEKGGKVIGAVLKGAAYVGDKIGDAAGFDAQARADMDYAAANPGARSVQEATVMQNVSRMVGSAASVSAPMSSGGSSMSYSSAPQINMTVNGGDPNAVKQAVRDALDEHAAATYDDLSSHAEAR